jgi:hypothetical protein
MNRFLRWLRLRRFFRASLIETASGEDLTLLARHIYGVERRTLELDRSVRQRCRETMHQLDVRDPSSEASRVLRVPVRLVSTSWEPGRVVLEAKRPWWRRRATWQRMVAEAQKAAERVCFAGVKVEVRS